MIQCKDCLHYDAFEHIGFYGEERKFRYCTLTDEEIDHEEVHNCDKYSPKWGREK